MTNAELLAQAQSALHTLMTGGAVRVVVDSNGERIEYSSANLAALKAYIATLQSTSTARGPMRPYF